MKLRRRLGGAAVAAAITGAALLLTAPAAGAATLDKVGWWYRPASAPGPLGAAVPAPPGTPEGGLVVQATPDGPNAVAALTFSLTPEELGGMLTLTVAGGTGAENAAIQACPAKAAWEAAQAGTFDKRPAEDCNFGSAPGTASEDGKTWTFDITALVVSGKVDIVLVPMALPEAGGAAPIFKPFSISFEKPTSASLAPPSGGGAADVGDLSADPGSFPSGDAAGSFAPDAGSASSGGGGDFSTPSVSGVALGGAGALDAAPPAPEIAPSAPAAGDALAATPAAATSGLANRRGLGLALIALCALTMLALGATRIPGVAAMLPPAMRPAVAGQAHEGGLGRFTRPRTGRAPAL